MKRTIQQIIATLEKRAERERAISENESNSHMGAAARGKWHGYKQALDLLATVEGADSDH